MGRSELIFFDYGFIFHYLKLYKLKENSFSPASISLVWLLCNHQSTVCSQPSAPISQQRAAEFISNATLEEKKKNAQVEFPRNSKLSGKHSKGSRLLRIVQTQAPPSGEPPAQTMSLNIYRRPAQNERKLVPHHNIELHEKATLDSFIIFQTSILKMLQVDWIKFKRKKV